MDDYDEKNTKKAKAGSFQAMGLEKELLNGLNRMGYKAPTPVQRKALPIALAGMDMVCMARTGSGKTCVFLLPLLNKIKSHESGSGVRAIVLSPTRELAMQTFKFAKDMAKFTDLRIVAIVGGDPIEAQFEALATRPDVIIATPGRLMHHLREISTFKLKQVQYLVFDEADRLFEMGFAEQLNEIVKQCPEGRQTLLFSATLPKQLVQFSRAGLRDPQLIRLDTDIKMSDELRLAFFAVRSNEKVAALLYLVRTIIPQDQQTIIFTATKHHSEFIYAMFNRIGITSTLVYGSMDQDARSANLNKFRHGEVSYLIVTDLAARGIDVPLLNNVINFHFPPSPKLFVHRCGRAARQGRIGFAFSLVDPEEMAYMMDVHIVLAKEFNASYNKPKDGETAAAVQPLSYNLETMTPDVAHTGLLPQDVLDEETEYFKKAITEEELLANLWRVSENGMKQYRRTRGEATHEGVKLAKSATKSNAVFSIHPLIVGCDPKRCSNDVVQKADFVRMLQTFRPAQTVFESGIGFGASSSAIKNVAKAGTKEAHGADIMREMRRHNAPVLDRNKAKHSTDVAQALQKISGASGSGVQINKEGEHAEGENDDEDDDDSSNEHGAAGGDKDEYSDDDESAGDDDQAADDDDGSVLTGHRHREEETVVPAADKPRLSIAEKKKLKKQGMNASQIREVAERKAATKLMLSEHGVSSNNSRGKHRKGVDGDNMGVLESLEISGSAAPSSFKDNKFFMSYGNEDEKARFADDMMQPQSGLRHQETQSVTLLESAMLDVDPDDAMELNRKKRILRWDAKKRKFVKQSLEEMANMKGLKRLRSESGAPVQLSKAPAGEMYEKWKKKTKREISMPGMGDESDDRPRPNMKHNSKVKDELRTPKEIKELKAGRANLKLKNMSKDKRRKIEGQQRKAKKSAEMESMKGGTKAGRRKVKAVLRT